MKRIVFSIVLGLIFFAGCSDKNDPELSQPLIETQSEVFAEVLLEIGDTVEVKEERIYSFSEIDDSLGPGPFSVNDLTIKYGKPISEYGTVISYSSGDIGIIVDFDGISFTLVANNGEKLSFKCEDFDQVGMDMPKCQITNSDRKISIKPFQSIVTNNNYKLPRDIKIGDTKQAVISAYDDDKGYVWDYDNEFIIHYNYKPDIIEKYTDDEEFNLQSQTGMVQYCFEDDILVMVYINWYNGYLAFD